MDLSQKIETYQPDETVRHLIDTTKIVLLVGISGAGKDTLKQQLLQLPEFADIVSYTTRAPRHNQGVMEQDGADYHFISEEQAAMMLDQHEFVEAKFVHGTVYGTGVAEIQAIHDAGRTATTDIDVQGVDEYKKLSQQVIAIFLLPPNYAEWRRRLRARYASEEEFDAEWPKRFASAIKELSRALEAPYYHFIINDALSETVRIAREIAEKPDIYNRKDDEARLAARDLLDELRTKE
jgi:guanylate kinase